VLVLIVAAIVLPSGFVLNPEGRVVAKARGEFNPSTASQVWSAVPRR
jgi:hypothetical protein